MKRFYLFFFAVTLFPAFVIAQFKQDLGLNSSWRGFKYIEQQINLTGSYEVRFQNFIAGIELGAECWYLNYPSAVNPKTFMKPSFTGKIEPWVGVESNLFRSRIFFSAEVGARFYFFNQLIDSLNLFKIEEDRFIIGLYSRKYVADLPVYGIAGSASKAQEYYVTKMPITFLTRVNLGYEFKRVKVSAFIMPYWVRFRYQNAAFSERTGKTTIFFYDLGLGVNYTLPFKKRENRDH